MVPNLFAVGLRRFAATLLILAAVPLFSQTLPDLDVLLVNVEARMATGFAYKNWTASSTSTNTEFDRHGAVVKVTVVNKTVRVTNGDRDEDILKAIETADGKTTDVTRETAEKTRQQWAKEREKRAAGSRRSGVLDLDEILPFAAKQRPLFSFKLRQADGEGGRKLAILEAAAKQKDTKLWNGTYTIDPVTFDILRAEVRPSDNPTFVRELWAEADMALLDGKNLFIVHTKMKVDGGFLFIKNVRMLVEDTYTDVKILK
jgi:hypothetical protein